MRREEGRGDGRRAHPSRDYVPEAPGRCNQSSHLKVASPHPDKAAKVYVTNARRTLAAAVGGAPHAVRPAPAGRAPREQARSRRRWGGPPAARWAERLPCSCSRGRRTGEKRRKKRG